MGRSGSRVKMSTVPCGRWRKPAEDGKAGNTIQNRKGACCDAFSVGEGTLADGHPRPRRAQRISHRAQGRIHARARRAASAAIAAAGGVPSAAERQGGRTRHSRRATGRPRQALALRVRHGRLHASPDEPRGRGNAILLRQAGSASNSTASPGTTASLRRAKSQRSASRKGCPARHPLVPRRHWIDGYSDFSLMRASSALNRHSTDAHLRLRVACQARVSRQSCSRLGMRRARQCRA